MTAASILALAAAVWLSFGGVGWAGPPQAGAALAVTAVALWSEPVQRVLHLGQVELLLMALIVADLCRPGHRWWRGAGIGLRRPLLARPAHRAGGPCPAGPAGQHRELMAGPPGSPAQGY
jgi:alpha-1,2-mannosyltransferase